MRIAVLLLVLAVVAGDSWLDRVETQSWKRRYGSASFL